MGPDRTHCRMEKESDVADRERSDLADFLVAQVALEFEVHDFALIGRERRDRVADPAHRRSRVIARVEIGDDSELVRVEGCHANRLLPRIEREVPAHGEQPWREVAVEAATILPAQPEKRLLHHIPRRFDVAQQARRVAD